MALGNLDLSTPVALGSHNHDTAYAPLTHSHAAPAHTHAEYAPVAHTHPATGPAVVKTTADQTISVVTLTDIAGLSMPIAANADLMIEALIVWQSAATTTGIRVALGGPAGALEVTALVEIQTALAALTPQLHTAYQGGAATASIDAANARRVARVSGVVRNGPNAGVVSVQAASEVAGSAVTVKRGSWARYS